jgi:uncharacterized protein YeaO (DUF488 family)
MGGNIKAANIRLKRAYEPPAKADGSRVLIDRLWPRGVGKAEAGIDRWLKDIAPSTGLRKWFNHDPARWRQFRQRYAAEVRGHPEPLRELRRLAREERVTLVYSARDEEHNDAVALRAILLGRWPKRE